MSGVKPISRDDLDERRMMCQDCGAKLWSIDGSRDMSMRCPYKCSGTGVRDVGISVDYAGPTST